jgi:hypothetical protein
VTLGSHLKVEVNLSLDLLIKQDSMKAYGRMKVYLQEFLISALCGGEWSASRPGRFAHIDNWVGTGAGVDVMGKRIFLVPTGNRTSVARSSSP